MNCRLIFSVQLLILLFCNIALGQKESFNQASNNYINNPKEIAAASQIQVEVGWNLLSLPLKMSGVIKDSLFPNASSDAFIYDDGYVPHNNTLKNGLGFWLKSDSANTIFITGELLLQDTINVALGWNIIGSLTPSIPLQFVSSEPNGMTLSEFYKYIPEIGYQSTDTIYPGYGYWIKVSQPGAIIMNSVKMPCPNISTVEYGGKIYNTVQIGTQCWLKENLDVGTMIQGIDTSKDNGILEKYCYDNDTTNCNKYGGLYQWDEAMQYKTEEGTQGICPSGWHIPTYSEFITLNQSVGAESNALKAIGQGIGDGAGTNISGFSALLAGGRLFSGPFSNLNSYAFFWCSTEFSWYFAFAVYLIYDANYISLYWGYPKSNGLSVRCLKD